MPDSPLYPVKLATEQVQLMLTPSQIDKARLCARLADRRVEEIIYMANKGDAQQVELITQRLDKRLAMLAVLASALDMGEAAEEAPMLMSTPAPTLTVDEAGAEKAVPAQPNNRAKLRSTVAGYAARHSVELRLLLEIVPESVRAALLQTIAVSEAGYEKALEALD